MHFQRQTLYFLRFTVDAACLFLAFFFSIQFLEESPSRELSMGEALFFMLLVFVWIISVRVTGLYNEFRSRNFSYELISIFKNISIQIIGAVFILFVLRDIALPRKFILLYALYLLAFLSVERFVIRRALNIIRSRGRNLRNLLIIGAGEVGRNFHQTILENPHFGYRVVGFLDDQPQSALNGQFLGSIEDLQNVLEKTPVDDVIVALPTYATERIDDVIKICENHTRRVRIIPDYFRFVSDKFEITMFGRFPLISVRRIKLDELHWYITKRIFDFFFSLFVLVFVLSWLVPIIAIAIKLSSKGNVFFRQERWGRSNKKIPCLKFRSMITESADLDETGRYQQATKDDPRITKIGRFLRKTNLDEIPQFWNVFLGQMSIVGPRPHPTPLNLESKDVIENYMLRHLVKPGISGWAQVNGYRGETKESALMQKRIDHDIWYIENWSFWLDLQIIFLTVWQMIKYDTKGS